MPVCATKYFGSTEYESSALVHFPAGLPGFEEEFDFLPLNIPGQEPLIYLQSIQKPDLCFVTLPVLAVDADYQLEMAEPDMLAIGLDPSRQPVAGKDVLCLAILTISEMAVTANLLAPIVLSLGNNRAVQAVAPAHQYSHQHPVRQSEEALCS
jgi:flagellar assembly factor FliW